MGQRTTITSVLVTAAVVLVLVGATPGAAAAEPSLTEIMGQHDLAVYEWHRLSQVNTTVTDQRLSALRGDGFTTVYADISEYVEVADQRASRTQQARLTQLNGELKRFVARARSQGFVVQAVAGAPTWTSQSRRYLGPKTVDLVVAYNKTAAANEQVQGVQLDIEPYVDPAWWKNVRASLKAYLSTVRAIVDRYIQVRAQPGSDGLRLGVAIPFWYDGTPEVPPVEFGPDNRSAPAAFHLIDMLGTYPEAYLVVLAYRNFASDDDPDINADGSIALVSGEFADANTSGAACGIVIGQEFGPESPEKVSFWWKGRAAFREAAGKLVSAYGDLPQFRGLSVNDLDFYESTPETVPE
jgi:hypothetical protein